MTSHTIAYELNTGCMHTVFTNHAPNETHNADNSWSYIKFFSTTLHTGRTNYNQYKPAMVGSN